MDYILFKEDEKHKNLSKAIFNYLGAKGSAGKHIIGEAVLPENNEINTKSELFLAKTTLGVAKLKMALAAPQNWYEGGIDLENGAPQFTEFFKLPRKEWSKHRALVP